MTAHPDTERAEFEDGAWYWVEREIWVGDPPVIAPACYKAECDAWYSHRFSGISTRYVKVLEPCCRAPSAAPVELPEPDAKVTSLLGQFASFNAVPTVRNGDGLYFADTVRALLAAAKEPTP